MLESRPRFVFDAPSCGRGNAAGCFFKESGVGREMFFMAIGQKLFHEVIITSRPAAEDPNKSYLLLAV